LKYTSASEGSLMVMVVVDDELHVLVEVDDELEDELLELLEVVVVLMVAPK